MPKKGSDEASKKEEGSGESNQYHQQGEVVHKEEKIKMVVATVVIDHVTQTPAVILKEEGGERFLPIWIGINEANAIMMELENIKFERPLTHDLVKNLFNTLGIKLEKVEVSDLKNATYYATLYIEYDGKKYQIDSRPSDAIAIALRLGGDIYVDGLVFDKTRSAEFIKGIPSAIAKRKEEVLLDIVSEEDFGKFKM